MMRNTHRSRRPVAAGTNKRLEEDFDLEERRRRDLINDLADSIETFAVRMRPSQRDLMEGLLKREIEGSFWVIHILRLPNNQIQVGAAEGFGLSPDKEASRERGGITAIYDDRGAPTSIFVHRGKLEPTKGILMGMTEVPRSEEEQFSAATSFLDRLIIERDRPLEIRR